MIILSWNYQGLGNPQVVKVLSEWVRKKAPTILFLVETKLIDREMEPIKRDLGFYRMLAMSCNGRRGELTLLWRADVTMDTKTYSPNHINVSVHTQTSPIWRLTGLYGHLEEELKPKIWRLLRHLHTRASLPWVCLDDFNELLASYEKMVTIVDRWLQWLNLETLSSLVVWLIWDFMATHIYGGTIGRVEPLLKRD